jgi:hypothetical protein
VATRFSEQFHFCFVLPPKLYFIFNSLQHFSVKFAMFAKGFYQNTYLKEDAEADKLFEALSDEENGEEIEIIKSGETDAVGYVLYYFLFIL